MENTKLTKEQKIAGIDKILALAKQWENLNDELYSFVAKLTG